MTLPALTEPSPGGPIRTHQRDPVELLTALHQEGRLAGGHAHILGLEAVREAFGRRWAERSGGVFDMARSHAERLFEPGDVIERVGEVELLIVSPGQDPMVARGLAARLISEILGHFLGEARPAALTLKTVTGFSQGELTCRAIDGDELTSARLAADAAERARGLRVEPDPGDGAGGFLGEPITTFDGRRLCIDFAIYPVMDLNHQRLAGHCLARRLTSLQNGRPLEQDERMALLAADMERVDLATLNRGLAFLQSRRALGETPSLVLAVSFLTASNQRARTKLLLRAATLKEAVRASVIWLLTDVPEGAPEGRLIEVASLLRPFGRAVFAETAVTGAAVKAARVAGIAGLMLEPRRSDMSETDWSLWLLQAGKLAHRSAPTLIAAGLASPNLLAMAAAAGFTHATIAIEAG